MKSKYAPKRKVARPLVDNMNLFRSYYPFSYTLAKWIGLEKDLEVGENSYSQKGGVDIILHMYCKFLVWITKTFYDPYFNVHRIPVTDSLKTIIPPNYERLGGLNYETSDQMSWLDLRRILLRHITPCDVVNNPTTSKDTKIGLYTAIREKLLVIQAKIQESPDEKTYFDAICEWHDLGLPAPTDLSSYDTKNFKYYSKQLQSELLNVGMSMKKLGIYKDVRVLIFATMVNGRRDRVR